MRILVLGATGRVGSSVVAQAQAAGHDVTAFVRDATKARLALPRTELAQGDIRQPGALEAALRRGIDAVVSAVGGDVFRPSTLVTDTARALVAGMKAAGVARLLAVSGVAEMPLTTFGRISVAIMRRSPIRHALRDHDGAFAILSQSGLRYTLAGCPHIRDEPPRGRYTTATRFPGGYRHIAPEDVARFLVEELAAQRYPDQIVGIWY